MDLSQKITGLYLKNACQTSPNLGSRQKFQLTKGLVKI